MGMTAAEILADLGIQAPRTTIGRFYTICPKCSHLRKPHNRKKRCLGVTIDDKGISYGCNNAGCDFQGGRFYDDQRTAHPVARKARDLGRNSGSFRNLYG